MKQRQLSELIDWIIDNRKGAAFKGYSKEKIEMELYESMFFNVLLLSEDIDGNIIGIICGDRNLNTKQLFVKDILTTKEGVVKLFLQRCHEWYPDYTIQGIKANGKYRKFTTAKQLMERLN